MGVVKLATLFYAPESWASHRNQEGLEQPRQHMTTKIDPLPLYLTAAEISERIMPINARTLKRAQLRGDIRGSLHGGKWRFETASVVAWINGDGQKVSPEPVITLSGKRMVGRPRKESSLVLQTEAA